jgi:cellulose synthase/poly-beta-1,6-N-acetylglucosamine synthase-like glycosyltransferase
MSRLKTAIGICAYNEEKNIGSLLQNLISEQNLPSDCKILVVCSGCTDRTIEVVKGFHVKDKRIEPIIEKTRTGKANALNRIFQDARGSADALILLNADALPEGGSIVSLVSELAASDAGVVFAQPVPFKGPDGICYRITKVIWRLHHLISLFGNPKLSGELCSIRTTCLRPIPEDVTTDEPYIELTVRRQGYQIRYLPEAVVHIRCPTNIVDLMKQRKRIWVGHMQLKKTTGFTVSTASFGNILQAVAKLKPIETFYVLLGGFLEMTAYSRARIDLRKDRVPYIWEPIRSTKISI